MGEINFLYPDSPANVPAAITQPSIAFKREVRGVLGSIVLFLIVYLVMFLLSIGLVIGCLYGGIAIVTHVRAFIGILAGVGMIGVGIMVFCVSCKISFLRLSGLIVPKVLRLTKANSQTSLLLSGS